MLELHAAAHLNVHGENNSEKSFLIAVVKIPPEDEYKLIISEHYVEINGEVSEIDNFEVIDTFKERNAAINAIPHVFQAAVDLAKDKAKEAGGSPDNVRFEVHEQ